MTSSSSRDYLYLPLKEGTKYKRNTCCCTSGEKCYELIDSFRKINDIRGQLISVPKTKENSRKKHESVMLQFWMDRAKVKLRLNNRRTPAKFTKDKFIALWHFHPHILDEKNRSIFFTGNNSMRKFVTVDDLERILGIKINSDGRYDKQDILI